MSADVVLIKVVRGTVKLDAERWLKVDDEAALPLEHAERLIELGVAVRVRRAVRIEL